MYFADFESFAQTQQSSKSFIVEVELIDGKVEVGSAIPQESYAQLMIDVATCDELKSAFALWTRGSLGSGCLVFIPYDKIRLIRVRFSK